jgi:tRNA (adenine57-N1/adenine58-N1)-methyltransferase
MNEIKAGDMILIHLDEKREYMVQAREELRLSSDLGEILIKDLIGKPYGFVGKTHLDRLFFCLKPSLSDLMMKVKRNTTVVYPKDLGYLLLETSIGPGSRVIEVGTGSGALTLVLARITAPDGKVYSYERKEEFSQNAKKNLERYGLGKNVEFFVRDVGLDGFTETDADAVFIDVPEPWDIVPKAAVALKGGHHTVSWSPNVEQVQKTVDAMKANHFTRINTVEIIMRDLLVRERGIRPREHGITHTAYLTSGQLVLPPT